MSQDVLLAGTAFCGAVFNVRLCMFDMSLYVSFCDDMSIKCIVVRTNNVACGFVVLLDV